MLPEQWIPCRWRREGGGGVGGWWRGFSLFIFDRRREKWKLGFPLGEVEFFTLFSILRKSFVDRNRNVTTWSGVLLFGDIRKFYIKKIN